MTGISLNLFTTWAELQAVKYGASTMMIAYTADKKLFTKSPSPWMAAR